jgi:hypothetical protein
MNNCNENGIKMGDLVAKGMTHLKKKTLPVNVFAVNTRGVK